jgi:hypothetical protein
MCCLPLLVLCVAQKVSRTFLKLKRLFIVVWTETVTFVLFKNNLKPACLLRIKEAPRIFFYENFFVHRLREHYFTVQHRMNIFYNVPS